MIRLYNVNDKQKLLDIFKLNTPTYFDVNEQVDFENYLNQFGETYFVVEKGGNIVGSGGYHFLENKTVGRISWDLFNPKFQNKGLGTQLIAHCIGKLKNEPTVKRLVVWTSQLAEKFYEKFGFKTAEIKKDFWGKGLDLFKMEFVIR